MKLRHSKVMPATSGRSRSITMVQFSPAATATGIAPAAFVCGTRKLGKRDHAEAQGEVLSLAFAPKTDLLAAGSWDKTVKVWDLNDRLWRLPMPRELGGR